MLGRKILKRITRLGMAFYAMVWCMSFTVCAYDNPIADMAMEGRTALMTAQEGEADGAVLDENLPGDTDLTLPAEGGETDPSQEDGQSAADPAQGSEEDDGAEDVDAPEAGQEEGQDTAEDPEAQDGPEEDVQEPETTEDAEVETETDEETDPDALGNETEELLSEEVEALDESLLGVSGSVEIGNYPDGYLIVTDINRTYDVSLSVEGITVNQSKVQYAVLQSPYDDNSLNYGSEVVYNEGDDCNYLTFYDLFPYTNAESLLIKANYTYQSEFTNITVTASLPVGVTNTVDNFTVNFNGSTGTEIDPIDGEIPAYDFGEIEDGNYTISLTDIIPANAEVNPYGYSWGVFYVTESGSWKDATGTGVSLTPDYYVSGGTQAQLSISEIEKDMRVIVRVSYDNYAYLPNDHTVDLPDPMVAACFDVKSTVPELEAHLSETSIKLQVYKSQNLVPVTIRTANATESYRVDYRINSVGFENSVFSRYFYPDVTSDGMTVNIKANSYTLNGLNKTALSELLKKKFSTRLHIWADVNGVVKDYYTAENLTISLEAKLPTAKDIKVANTVEFNSYYALQEERTLEFEGVDSNYIAMASDSSLLNKTAGMHQSGSLSLALHPSDILSKKGSVKIRFYIWDSVNWNLPGGFYLDLPVNFVIKHDPTVLTMDKTSVTLNNKLNQTDNITFRVTNELYDGAQIEVRYYNSKNQRISGSDFPFTVERVFNTGNYTGWCSIKCNNNTKPGSTYKLELVPVNTHNGNYGKSQTITIKTVDSKNEDKVSISASGKGSIDACVPNPYKYINLTLTSKNANLYDSYTEDYSVSLKNGTDVTPFFVVQQDKDKSDLFKLYAYNYYGDSEFPLIDYGLAGQQVTFKLSFDLTGSKNPADYVNVTYSTKIAKTKVTPKFGFTSASVNPQSFNSTNEIYVPIVSEYSWMYDYNITCDLGESSPIGAKVVNENGMHLKLSPKTGDLSSYAGKTINYKVTPDIPGGNAGTATFKVTIQKPAKVTVSAKVSGDIDSICDFTYASINVTYKNIYITNSTVLEYECLNITTKQGKSEVNATTWFDTSSGQYNEPGSAYNTTIKISRDRYTDIPAGTYKAVIRCYYYDKDASTPDKIGYVDTTASFKVKRGKPNLTVTPSPATLVNRDFARTATVTIAPKTAGVNDVSEVLVTGSYAGNVTLTRIGDTTYRLEFSNDYYEGSWVKKVWMAITKNVTRTIPVEVYFDGSTTPDKVNLKVKINA